MKLLQIATHQPFTPRGVAAFAVAVGLIQFVAVPEKDLVASILGGSILLILIVVLFAGFILRRKLRDEVKVSLFFPKGRLVSRERVSSGFQLVGSNIFPFFSLHLTRKFLQPGVISPTHSLRGSTDSSGQRRLLDAPVFPHRGLWQLGAASFSLQDRLGLSRFCWETELLQTIEISPPIIGIRPLPIIAASAQSGDLHTQARERAGDMFDIKTYDPSDGIKRILWKTFAKSRQLVVRRPEPAVLPEGEMPIYLVAAKDEDEVAGAFLGYLRQLEQANVVVLFGSDGISSLGKPNPKEASENQPHPVANCFATDPDEIEHILNASVWTSSAGSGEGFADYLLGLQLGGKIVQRALIFLSENKTSLIPQLNAVAAQHNLELSFATVPKEFGIGGWRREAQATRPGPNLGSEIFKCEYVADSL